MRRALAFFFLALPGLALAQHDGYAFDQPEVLAAQRAWGIVHAVKLLARACAQAGDTAAVESWLEWQERERREIEATMRQLARHHFAAETVAPAALSAALGLATQLSLEKEERQAACATLPAALASGRYDLARRKQEWLKP